MQSKSANVFVVHEIAVGDQALRLRDADGSLGGEEPFVPPVQWRFSVLQSWCVVRSRASVDDSAENGADSPPVVTFITILCIV